MTAHGWMVRNAHSPQLNYSMNQNTSFTFDALRMGALMDPLLCTPRTPSLWSPGSRLRQWRIGELAELCAFTSC